MRHIGSTDVLSGAAERRRATVAEMPLEKILSIPHTMVIRAKLAMLTVGPDGAGAAQLSALLDAKADAAERDELAASRPDGCWCFGRGGAGERAVLVPGQDVPTVLGVYCKCPDGVARHELDDQVRHQGKAYADGLKVQSLWDGARIPKRFDGCTLKSFPATTSSMRVVVRRVADWVGTDEWALVLLGPYGVGKSGLSIGALRLAAQRHQVGLYVKAPDLLTRVRATYGKNADASEQDVVESLRTVPYLVLDDVGVGAESLNDWATTLLFQVIDDRHDNHRKTIITTNLDIPGLAVHVGERTMQRLHEAAVFLTIDGPNLRKDEKGS